MAASKKQVGELENAIVILEERLEKLEEEHAMMKQMISMQNALIDNLQMMVKMMSNNSPLQGYQVGYVHMGGDQSNKQEVSEKQPANQSDNSQAQEDIDEQGESSKKPSISAKQKFHNTLKARMLRVV